MEIHKKLIGWQCVLNPSEVEYSSSELVLQGHLNRLRKNPDGSATFRVAPWCIGSGLLMELFKEGLGEGGFGTYNVYNAGKQKDIIEREY